VLNSCEDGKENVLCGYGESEHSTSTSLSRSPQGVDLNILWVSTLANCILELLDSGLNPVKPNVLNGFSISIRAEVSSDVCPVAINKIKSK
jgi:hypothetical protein